MKPVVLQAINVQIPYEEGNAVIALFDPKEDPSKIKWLGEYLRAIGLDIPVDEIETVDFIFNGNTVTVSVNMVAHPSHKIIRSENFSTDVYENDRVFYIITVGGINYDQFLKNLKAANYPLKDVNLNVVKY